MSERSDPELTVAVIGAGPLGRWLALEAARSGMRVWLEDVLPSNLNQARESLHQLDQMGEPCGRLGFAATIEDAVRHADLVIDCVPDELESKLEILCLLDRMAPPKTVFATPTMELSIADLASCTYRPERCIAIRSAPAALGKLQGQRQNKGLGGTPIRLEAAPASSPEAVALVESFWRRLGFAAETGRADR